MPDYRDLFRRPSDQTLDEWFTALVHQLLNGTRLLVAGEPHRLVELEVYYHVADHADHADPFAHRDPVQRESGRWYFHRTGGNYRSGSFKGLDFTFGDGTAFGGILIRSLEKPDGSILNGPSLLVDYLLKQTERTTVAALDQALAKRCVWDDEPLLRLESINETHRPCWRTARVGLSLKRIKPTPENVRFLLRPYRYLTDPRRIAKGKVPLVLSMHEKGVTEEVIKEWLGCPLNSIRRYIQAYEVGKSLTDFAEFSGRNLSSLDLCRLHGMARKTD